MATKYNQTVDQNATFAFQISYKATNGTAIDLTNYKARMQVRPTPESSQIILELTSTPANGITLNSPTGNIAVSVNAKKTGDVPAGKYVYDLVVEDATGVITRLIEGSFEVKPSVTR